MKKFYTLFLILISLTGFSQVESNIAPNLNQECNVTVCQDIKFGACPGDTYSDGSPVNNTDFQIYYSDVDIIINFNSVTFRNCRFELRNGANLVDNGVQINIETDCDNENTTEIVFIGGGDRFSSVEEMNATLSIEDVDFYKRANVLYYDVLGRSHKSLETLSNGIYIIEYSLDGRVERKKKIKSL